MPNRKNILFQAFYWGIIFPVTSILLLELVLQLVALGVTSFSDRSTQKPWQASSGALRILAIGDSNTYGTYLKLEESYPKQLETLWNQRHEKKIEVINAGYPGTSSAGIVKNLPRLLETFDPDITLVMIGTNDFWTEPETEVAAALETETLWQIIKRSSRTWKLLQIARSHEFNPSAMETLERPQVDDEALKALQQIDKEQLEKHNAGLRTGLIEADKRQIRYQGETFDFSNTLATEKKTESKIDPRRQLENNLAAIARYAKKNDHKIIFVSYAGNKFFYKAANRALARAYEANQFPYVDVTESFRQLCPKHHICPEYLFFDQHATAAGNHIVAEKIMTYLEGFIAHE